MRVILIAGGWSSERDVALAGGDILEASLKRLGHDVERYDPQHDLSGLTAAVRGADFAFLNLHGAPGEDGLIQAMLDQLGCPYQGTGPAGSFLALHKAAAKELFAVADLPTPRGVYLPKDPGADWAFPYDYPVFVKPNVGGSSLGLGLAKDPAQLRHALEAIWAGGDGALVEESAPGVELTCAILDEEALPVIMIKPKLGEFFDYASKYEEGGAEEICPAPIPEAIRHRVQAMALRAHHILRCQDYSRADFIWDGAESVQLLEVNTLPGMATTSLVPKAVTASGMDFDDFVHRLMELGLARTRKSA